MPSAVNRELEYLRAVAYGRQLLAKSCRERNDTPVNGTVVRALRWFFVITLAACGGARHGDTYAKATQAQQVCCEHLAGGPRDACLQKIVRVTDPEVARSSTNQASYACIEEHFVCDPQTGHATQASSQAAMDCIQDLQ